MTDGTKGTMSIVGVGAAACAACCAVPIMGLIAAAGVATVVAYAAIGAVAFAVVVPLVVWTIRRRRARAVCTADPSPQHVELTATRRSLLADAGVEAAPSLDP